MRPLSPRYTFTGRDAASVRDIAWSADGRGLWTLGARLERLGPSGAIQVDRALDGPGARLAVSADRVAISIGDRVFEMAPDGALGDPLDLGTPHDGDPAAWRSRAAPAGLAPAGDGGWWVVVSGAPPTLVRAGAGRPATTQPLDGFSGSPCLAVLAGVVWVSAAGAGSRVQAAAASPIQLAAGSDACGLFDAGRAAVLCTQTGAEVWRHDASGWRRTATVIAPGEGAPSALAVRPEDGLFALAQGADVWLFDAAGVQVGRAPEAGRNLIGAMALSEEALAVASSGQLRTLDLPMSMWFD